MKGRKRRPTSTVVHAKGGAENQGLLQAAGIKRKGQVHVDGPTDEGIPQAKLSKEKHHEVAGMYRCVSFCITNLIKHFKGTQMSTDFSANKTPHGRKVVASAKSSAAVKVAKGCIRSIYFLFQANLV